MKGLLSVYLKPMLYGLVAALLVLLGIQTTRLSAEQEAHLRTKTAHAEVLRALAEKAAQTQQAVNTFIQATAHELSEKDAQHIKELTHAQTENQRLRSASRNGTASVRIKGYDCTARTDSMPAPTFSGSLGDAGAKVDGELREAVFDHRAALIQAERQIKYLQDYAALCQKVPEQ